MWVLKSLWVEKPAKQLLQGHFLSQWAIYSEVQCSVFIITWRWREGKSCTAESIYYRESQLFSSGHDSCQIAAVSWLFLEPLDRLHFNHRPLIVLLHEIQLQPRQSQRSGPDLLVLQKDKTQLTQKRSFDKRGSSHLTSEGHTNVSFISKWAQNHGVTRKAQDLSFLRWEKSWVACGRTFPFLSTSKNTSFLNKGALSFLQKQGSTGEFLTLLKSLLRQTSNNVSQFPLLVCVFTDFADDSCFPGLFKIWSKYP